MYSLFVLAYLEAQKRQDFPGRDGAALGAGEQNRIVEECALWEEFCR